MPTITKSPPRVFVHNGPVPCHADRKLVLVDMDGTLADCRHREHHIQGKRKNWPAFFRGMSQDPANTSIVELTRRLAADLDIVIVTGRPQEYLDDTTEWLARNRIAYCELYMRRAGDRRPDYVAKREMLDALPRERVAFVLDDRESVCQMWTDAGLTCHRVQQGQCALTK